MMWSEDARAAFPFGVGSTPSWVKDEIGASMYSIVDTLTQKSHRDVVSIG